MKRPAAELYRPRGEYVLLKFTRAGQTPSGIAVPDKATEGHTWHVLAVGPKVDDLEPDQRVLVMGSIGADIAVVPNEKDVYITKQQNVLLILAEPPKEVVSLTKGAGDEAP